MLSSLRFARVDPLYTKFVRWPDLAFSEEEDARDQAHVLLSLKTLYSNGAPYIWMYRFATIAKGERWRQRREDQVKEKRV